jgi:hypothetical protein
MKKFKYKINDYAIAHTPKMGLQYGKIVGCHQYGWENGQLGINLYSVNVTTNVIYKNKINIDEKHIAFVCEA